MGWYNSFLICSLILCSSCGYIRQVLQSPCRLRRLRLCWHGLSYMLRSCSSCPVSFPTTPTYSVSFTPLRSLICPMFMRFRLLYVSPTSACQILTGTYIRSHCYIVQTFGRCFHLSTMASADFSQFVVTTANETAREISRDKSVFFPRLPS